jgi:hypothetical protein
MSPRQLIELQLDAIFGSPLPEKVQALVDAEVNEGHWLDGYELAYTSPSLDQVESLKLIKLMLAQHPQLQIDRDRLLGVVDKELPQSHAGTYVVRWIVDESGSYALTDSLRVARFDGSRMIWRSPRISWDGIEFDSLIDGRLRGRAWLLGNSMTPDVPFEFDFESGQLLAGDTVSD